MPFATLPPGSFLGRFRIVRVLGQGGMGVVYEAVEPALDRRVALKVLPRELADDETARARFRREARAAASVKHPNVVGVHHVGTESGLDVIALEFLTGGTLKAHAKGRALLWREAASLGAQIASGLAAIHAAGIVHRDLKPENVLLDEEGQPRLTDFGLATPGGSAEQLTRTGELLGTLEYIAPEQADDAKRADARSDLYSLGALLYALLAGKPPFQGTGYELVKKHLSDRPMPPSKLGVALPERLERLVLGLLEKAPAARPQPAAAVARELEAIGRGEQKEAEEGARSVAPLVAALLVLAAALAGVAFVLARPRPRPGGEQAGPSPLPAPPQPARPADEHDLLRGFREGPGFKLREPIWGSHAWKQRITVQGVAFSPDGKRAATGGDGTRLWDLSTGREVWSARSKGNVFSVAFHPAGTFVLTGSDASVVQVLDAKDGKLVRELDAGGGTVPAVAWSRDGETFFAGSGKERDASDVVIHAWDTETGSLVRSLRKKEQNGTVNGLAALPDGRLLEAGNGGFLVLWDVANGEERGRWQQGWYGRLTSVSATNDGRLAVVSALDQGVPILWDVERKKARAFEPRLELEAMKAAVSPDGTRIVCAGREGFDAWDSSGKLLWAARTPDWIWSIAVSPDGKRVLTGHVAGVIRLWDLEGQRPLAEPAAFSSPVKALAWDPKRNLLTAAAFTERTIELRDSKGREREIAAQRHVISVAVSADGSLAAFREAKSGQRIFYAPEATEPYSADDVPLDCFACAFSPNGRRTLAGDENGFLHGFDENHDRRFACRTAERITAVAFADADRWLCGGATGSVTCGDFLENDFAAESVTPRQTLGGSHDAKITAVAARGKLGASGDEKGRIQLWDLSRGSLVAGLDPPHEKAIGALAVSEGQLLASASEDGTIAVWRDGKRVATIDLASSSDHATALLFEKERTLHAGTARGVVLTFELTDTKSSR